MKIRTSRPAILVASAVLGVVALAGCASSSETPDTTEAAKEAKDALAASDEETPESEGDATDDASDAPLDGSNSGLPPSLDATNGQSALFGGQYTYGDGLIVRVGKLKPYSVSDNWLLDHKKWPQVTFQVTVFNGTDDRYDPSGIYSTASSGGREGEEIFDSANGIDGTPSTTLRPGKKVSFDLAYAVKDADDIDLEISPGYDDDFNEWAPILFTTSAS
ncbi:hypothetical protein CLV56_3537 [Mumia flava]|uniref:DUF4352 domain-containing protein n=1 Tax=Mumia flava TaxID=1348852 RepID=A0A0B2BL95_9ACTN|nr:hypothetical protein [Mumia flava]PJJ54034.1 hypothetical protein CLV56_3537 [Mumia flava]